MKKRRKKYFFHFWGYLRPLQKNLKITKLGFLGIFGGVANTPENEKISFSIFLSATSG